MAQNPALAMKECDHCRILFRPDPGCHQTQIHCSYTCFDQQYMLWVDLYLEWHDAHRLLGHETAP